MKKTIPLILALTLSLASTLSLAQKLEPIAEIPPPPAGANDPEPEITIRNRGGDRYEEYRLHGQLYMIKVTPRVGPVYYLVSRERGGAFQRVNDLDRAQMIPQWVLFSW
ncbi:DUF2782 domain-containing protein [Uliginosibacterium aquaticum]|uniref:DUF2782 domain-containing protein n=1 Tax=Uliginosibacterium aquaticum TaxID=2731212 RepID=A0ABX2IJE1_9RHOO|nr:DUF2782 domain-containing protein [Uliginosibacterium aquaticum]NSL56956.1 DUF2782 domain-containing protein [Uliginosibacterium aquaticum]